MGEYPIDKEFFLDGKRGKSALLGSNSAFLWGESIFTVMLMEGGYYFLEDHLERVKQGLEWQWGIKWVCEDIFWDCLKKIQDEKRKKVRLAFFRGEDEKLHWLLSAAELLQLSPKGIRVKSCLHPHLPMLRPASVKVGNYSETLRIYRQALQEGLDDVLFINSQGHILEAMYSNVFFFRGREFWTPGEQEGMLSGIGRKYAIRFLRLRGYEIRECSVKVEEIGRAQGAFLVSCLRGFIPLIKIDSFNYQRESESYAKGWEEYQKGHKTVLS